MPLFSNIPFTLPYTSWIFSVDDNSNIYNLFNNTGKSLSVTNIFAGVMNIYLGAEPLIYRQIMVIVTPMRQTNNHSICVEQLPNANNFINLYCVENQSNTPTNDGFYFATYEIRFFQVT